MCNIYKINNFKLILSGLKLNLGLIITSNIAFLAKSEAFADFLGLHSALPQPSLSKLRCGPRRFNNKSGCCIAVTSIQEDKADVSLRLSPEFEGSRAGG